MSTSCVQHYGICVCWLIARGEYFVQLFEASTWLVCMLACLRLCVTSQLSRATLRKFTKISRFTAILQYPYRPGARLTVTFVEPFSLRPGREVKAHNLTVSLCFFDSTACVLKQENLVSMVLQWSRGALFGCLLLSLWWALTQMFGVAHVISIKLILWQCADLLTLLMYRNVWATRQPWSICKFRRITRWSFFHLITV